MTINLRDRDSERLLGCLNFSKNLKFSPKFLMPVDCPRNLDLINLSHMRISWIVDSVVEEAEALRHAFIKHRMEDWNETKVQSSSKPIDDKINAPDCNDVKLACILMIFTSCQSSFICAYSLALTSYQINYLNMFKQ